MVLEKTVSILELQRILGERDEFSGFPCLHSDDNIADFLTVSTGISHQGTSDGPWNTIHLLHACQTQVIQPMDYLQKILSSPHFNFYPGLHSQLDTIPYDKAGKAGIGEQQVASFTNHKNLRSGCLSLHIDSFELS
jgi:hypothetical protein